MGISPVVRCDSRDDKFTRLRHARCWTAGCRSAESSPFLGRRNRGSERSAAVGGVRTKPGEPCRASVVLSSRPRPTSPQLMFPSWFDESRSPKVKAAGPVRRPAAKRHADRGRPSHRASPEIAVIGDNPRSGVPMKARRIPGGPGSGCRCGESRSRLIRIDRRSGDHSRRLESARSPVAASIAPSPLSN